MRERRFVLKSKHALVRMHGDTVARLQPALVVVNASKGVFEVVCDVEEELSVLEEHGLTQSQVIDYGENYLVPGCIDVGFLYFHSKEGPNEFSIQDVEAQAFSAAAGGITTLIDSPCETLPSKLALQFFRRRVQKLRSARTPIDVGTLARLDLSVGFDANTVTQLLRTGAFGVIAHASVIRTLSNNNQMLRKSNPEGSPHVGLGGNQPVRQLCNCLAEKESVLVIDWNKVGRKIYPLESQQTDGEKHPCAQPLLDSYLQDKENAHLQPADIPFLPPEEFDFGGLELHPDDSDDDNLEDEISGALANVHFDSPWSQRSFNASTTSSESKLTKSFHPGVDYDDESWSVQYELGEMRRRCLVNAVKTYFAERGFGKDTTVPETPESQTSKNFSTPPLAPSRGFAANRRTPSVASATELMENLNHGVQGLYRTGQTNRNRSSSVSSASSLRSLRRQRRGSSFSLRSWRLDRDEECSEDSFWSSKASNAASSSAAAFQTPGHATTTSSSSSRYETSSLDGSLTLPSSLSDEESFNSPLHQQFSSRSPPGSNESSQNTLLDTNIIRDTGVETDCIENGHPVVVNKTVPPRSSAFSSPGRTLNKFTANSSYRQQQQQQGSLGVSDKMERCEGGQKSAFSGVSGPIAVGGGLRARGGSFDKPVFSRKPPMHRHTNSLESFRGVLSQVVAQQPSDPFVKPEIAGRRVSKVPVVRSSSSELKPGIVFSGRKASGRAPVRGEASLSSQSISAEAVAPVVKSLSQLGGEIPQVHLVCGCCSSEETTQFAQSLQSTIRGNPLAIGGVAKQFCKAEHTLPEIYLQSIAQGIAFEDALRPFTEEVALLLGLGRRKGEISPGMDADFVVLAFSPEPYVQETFCRGLRVLQREGRDRPVARSPLRPGRFLSRHEP